MYHRRMGLSSHQRSTTADTCEWLTPPGLLLLLGYSTLTRALLLRVGVRGLLAISPWNDGLSREWVGRVWMNPPFGRDAVKWMRRLAAHGDGIALLPAGRRPRCSSKLYGDRRMRCCFLRAVALLPRRRDSSAVQQWGADLLLPTVSGTPDPEGVTGKWVKTVGPRPSFPC